jgi:hypothetical protein
MVSEPAVAVEVEERADRWLVQLRIGTDSLKEVTFKSSYRPTAVLVGNDVVSWSANEISAVNVHSLEERRQNCREFIQSVIPIGTNRVWVVGDTYVSLLNLDTWNEQFVLDHDEIFAETSWDGSLLTLKDLEGKVMQVRPPSSDA